MLEKFDDRAYYIVTYEGAEASKGTYHAALELDIIYTDVRLRDGEYLVRAEVSDRDAIDSFREYCRDNDIPFRIQRIYREGPSVEGSVLTDAQREALTVAYERGYFDSPREATLEVVADELGISRQAVADRLRRGHRRLIEATLV